MRERGAIVMVFTPRAENLRRRVAGRGVSVVCEERSGPDENGLASINSERMWIAGRRGASLLPVALFRVGARHFVADGHHRLSVAHAPRHGGNRRRGHGARPASVEASCLGVDVRHQGRTAAEEIDLVGFRVSLVPGHAQSGLLRLTVASRALAIPSWAPAAPAPPVDA